MIILFLLAELVDIITTLVNLRIPGMYEANPFIAGLPTWGWITFKLVTTVIICVVMKRLDFGKKVWVIPALAWLPRCGTSDYICTSCLNKKTGVKTNSGLTASTVQSSNRGRMPRVVQFIHLVLGLHRRGTLPVPSPATLRYVQSVSRRC